MILVRRSSLSASSVAVGACASNTSASGGAICSLHHKHSIIIPEHERRGEGLFVLR